MIRYKVETISNPIKALTKFVGSFDDTAYDVFEEAYNEVESPFLDALMQKPGPAKKPIDWTTDKQQAAYFASDGFGGGIPTHRTGALSDAWTVTISRAGNQFLFVAENPLPASKFLFGSLAKNRKRALRYQQRFHANTGWPVATDIVQEWTQKFVELYQEKLSAIGVAEINRRAFTR